MQNLRCLNSEGAVHKRHRNLGGGGGGGAGGGGLFFQGGAPPFFWKKKKKKLIKLMKFMSTFQHVNLVF